MNLIWRPVRFLESCRERYGDTFQVRVWNPLGRANLVFTSHPDAIKAVFTATDELLRAGQAARPVLMPFVGEHSILVIDGAEHRRQRKLMLPSFHGERMRAYAETMRELTLCSLTEWPRSQPFAVHPRLQRITLEIILRTVFGLEDGASMQRLGAQLISILDMAQRPMVLSPLSQINWGPRSQRATFLRRRAAADQSIYEEIARRRVQDDLAQRTDVLALLLGAVDDKGESMTDEELRDELVTMLTAGHETTATSMAWVLDLILGRRDVYQRLVAEIDEVVGTEPVNDDMLTRLPYLDAVIKEALRLRPVVPNVARVAQAPFTLRGFDIVPGTVVAPSIYLTHHSPDLYPQPYRFIPDRFVNTKPNPYAWLPFGGGGRRCLGMAFALFEMKIVLATILSQMELGLAPTSTGRMARRGITFAPSDGTLITARRRPAFARSAA
jgi:cytochrome P450